MPPMIATSVAIPRDKEYELDQDREFELDIRISSITTQPVPFGKLTPICTDTCHTCHIVNGHCINTDNCA